MTDVKPATLFREVETASPRCLAARYVWQTHRHLQNLTYQARLWRGPGFIPFDEAFGHVQRMHRRPPRAIPTPEVPQLPIRKEDIIHPYLRQDTYVIPEDYTAVLQNVLYCPRNNVILTEDRQVVAESANTLPLRKKISSKVRPLSGSFALMRSCYEAYYHIVVENAFRLLAINRSPFSEWPEIKLLCPGRSPTPFERYLLARLAPSNATLHAPDDGSLYRLPKLIFTPFKSRRLAGYLPEEYVERFRDCVLPDRPSRNCHRLFISRECTTQRRVKNRAALMCALEKRGFTKIISEHLSPQEQVNLFYDAEAVVATHGSGLANTVFGVNLKVVELIPTHSLLPHFYYLSESLGHVHGIWSGDRMRRWPADFEVNVAGVLQLLDRMEVV